MICSTCEADGIVHTGHNMLRIAASLKNLIHSVSGDVHGGIKCNACGGPVRGSRYKCLQCDDFDLCSSCEAKGTEHSHHLLVRLPSRIPAVRLSPDLDGLITDETVLLAMHSIETLSLRAWIPVGTHEVQIPIASTGKGVGTTGLRIPCFFSRF
ncbi:unnamed protein product [Darwinula stevensoni]|uniref:ZZ-type domain-containing protein n=1 Tax=Darwinula stevensoni TaxID=69355 RepID=A0A7R9AJ10_9CRUS|nr:unnamed protein product [Darwinula stevensoni]CAG0907403.1 unnamed protein product [Darwinula stevensoni]